jgi:hypothetical protein
MVGCQKWTSICQALTPSLPITVSRQAVSGRCPNRGGVIYPVRSCRIPLININLDMPTYIRAFIRVSK